MTPKDTTSLKILKKSENASGYNKMAVNYIYVEDTDLNRKVLRVGFGEQLFSHHGD